MFSRILFFISLAVILGAANYEEVTTPPFFKGGGVAERLLKNDKPKRYYGHDVVLDKYGVIAPWYNELNGQCDLRLRIAVETLKRYPWTNTKNAIVSYPDYLFTSNWKIDSSGKITPRHEGNWSNGDLGQRAYGVLEAMVNYYRYSGDPAAIAHLTYMGDYVLDYCLTPADHPWPGFPISVPTKGKPYGRADPAGMIQLDIAAAIGQKLLIASKITKNTRWLDAAKHWGDLLAAHCNINDSTAPPWPRYAVPENLQYQEHPDIKLWYSNADRNLTTGSVVMILGFLDELIRTGYTGDQMQIQRARDAGVRYLQKILLPRWMEDKTWGCNFWDWVHTSQESSISAYASAYMMNHKDLFPNWKNDVRNILGLFLNRSSVNPGSSSGVFSGAWAYPESAICCDRSLFYAPITVGTPMAQYAVEANDDRMREMAYRQVILLTYDIHESGVTEDNIDGGTIVNGDWLNIAVPLPLLGMLQAMEWLPEQLAPNRENHLLRTSSVVDSIIYSKEKIEYSTFDAPEQTIDMFRLSYLPSHISADGEELSLQKDLHNNGYTVKKLPNGDAIVFIRHDGKKKIIISGNDPQQQMNLHNQYAVDFTGNQVRLIGRVDQNGGKADVFIDGEKQNGVIDFWNPSPRVSQVVYYKNGLQPGKHSLKIVRVDSVNPYSKGNNLYIDAIQYSDESARYNYPSGTGPTGPQRMIFGYTGRKDYKDSHGKLWRPATEIITRLGKGTDPVAQCWMPEMKNNIGGTSDPELYRYGYQADDFRTNLTVGPGKYRVTLKFTSAQDKSGDKFDIIINDKIIHKDFNVAAAAKGINRATDITTENIVPQDGIISIRLKASSPGSKAFIQALEINSITKK